MFYLIYGVFCYAVFFLTFSYFALFTGDLFVPKTIDSGAEPINTALAILINSLPILLFAVQHTIMARPAFKERWTQIIPKPCERSTFVLIASSILIVMFIVWQPMPMVLWDVQTPALRGVIWALFALGWGIVLYSSFLIDHFDLFGLRQTWFAFRGREYTRPHFAERSLYKRIRHPLMLGFMIAFWSSPTMTLGHMLMALLFTSYAMVGILFEERDLIAHHGRAYLEYMDRTGAVLPRMRRGAKVSPARATVEDK